MAVNYAKDENDSEVLLKNEEQVMMEWERPYMEKSIDLLSPKGSVLEVGFGFGYSATRIMKHNPKSYTIIECEPVVIEKIKKWREKYKIPVHIVEGRWQEKLHGLGKFDEIYFDDYPLDITQETDDLGKGISMKRFGIFLEMCIQSHTKINSKISCYLNCSQKLVLSSGVEPFVEIKYEPMSIEIPENCKYRDVKEQECLIPLITKTKEYSLEVVNYYAMQEIKKLMNK